MQLQVMFFDAGSDYLPYYKKFDLDVRKYKKIRDLCAAVKEMDENFDYDGDYPLVRINGLVAHGSQNIDEVCEVVGDEWRVEPAWKYRCVNDLVMDESDFHAAYKLIEPYASMEDRFFFASLKDVHYASSTLEFDKEYIGDAVLVTAHRMISRGNEHKEAILKAISEDVSGLWSCEYEKLTIGGRDFTEQIEELKSWATPPRPDLFSRLCSKLARPKPAPAVQTLEDLPVALYFGDEKMKEWIGSRGAMLISFSKERRKAGQSLVKVNPDLAYKKGAAVLLDAMDSGADLLVTGSVEDARYFRSNFSNFERASGREIYIDIIAFEELQGIKLKEEVK